MPGFKQLWSIKMNFLKKAAAAALSAVMLAGMTLPAYAEADGTALIKTGDGSTMLVVDFGNETSVIDPATGDSSGDPGTIRSRDSHARRQHRNDHNRPR